MQLDNVRRIIVEDFKKEDHELVSKLAATLNTFMDQTTDLSRKKIDYDNLNRSLVTLDITVNASGQAQGVTLINTNLSTYNGNKIVDVQSLKAGAANVISAPYLDCTPQGGGIVKINKFYGIAPNTKVRVKIEFIG